MPRKEKTNAKTWERERRNRMNSYFKTLGDLLPPSQEGKNRNKVDILIHASKYIKDLTNRAEELLHAHAVDAYKEELNRLKKLVAQLYSRTQLLSTLLKDAGITVPAEPALEKISPLKWSNKINVEDAEKYLDRLKERSKPEKRKNNISKIKVPSKKKAAAKSTTSQKKLNNDKEALNNNGPVEDQENHVNSSLEEREDGKNDEIPIKNSELRSNAEAASTNESETPEIAGPKSCSGIRKLESKKKVKRKNKCEEEQKKINNSITTIQNQNQSITNLVPGTLILSGGKIMPLITPLAQNILVNGTTQSPSSIILGNNQTNSMIVMQSLTNQVSDSGVSVRSPNIAKAVQKVTLNTVPSIQTNVRINSHDWVSNVKSIVEATRIGGRKGILPKGKDITKTTMAYKVPIPVVHRDVKINKTTNTSSPEKVEKKSRIKKIFKSKKPQEKGKKDKNEQKEDVNITKVVSEESGKKRKNENDSGNDSPPAKVVKILPETCESIENLRHVIEKIGETSNDVIEKLNHEKCESNSENKSNLKSDNNSSIEKEAELVLAVSEANKSDIEIKNCSLDILKLKENEVDLPKKVNSINEVDKSYKVSNNPEKESLSIKIAEINQLTAEKQSPISDSLPRVEKVITEVNIEKEKEDCDLGTRFDNLLHATDDIQVTVTQDNSIIGDSTKIILNLDTNTTTTMKPETSPVPVQSLTESSTSTSTAEVSSEVIAKVNDKLKENIPKTLSYSTENSFIPIGNRAEALHSDLSNDLFASLQVPSSSHNPESISPTAAFLMAFPLVSSLNGKTEVLEEEMKEDLKYHSQTPPMLLQIGAIEPNSFKVKTASNDDKCANEKNTKNSQCQSQSQPQPQPQPQSQQEVKTVETSTSKALPKVINNETFKERLYKVVSYSEPAISGIVNNFTNSSTSTTSNITQIPANNDSTIKKISPLNNNTNNSCTSLLTSSSNCETDKKVPQKTDATLGKYDGGIPANSTESTPVDGINKLGKFNNTRYPNLPEYLPTYPTFVSSGENSMLPVDNSKIYQQPITTVASQEYQPRNLEGLVSSSQSIQYQFSSQDSQKLYIEPHGTQSNYVIPNKENNSQISYQEYSLSQTKNNTLNLTSSQLTSRSYIEPRSSNNLSSSSLTDKISTSGNSYQGFLSMVQNKEQGNHRVSEVQSQNIAQSYSIQVKQTPSMGSFIPASTTDQRSKLPENIRTKTLNQDNQSVETSINSSVNKINSEHFVQANNFSYENKDSKSNNLISDGIFQEKRGELQPYTSYSRGGEQKKIFDGPTPPNVQISKSHGQTSSLSRYPHQLQQQPAQQQTFVATSNYGQTSVTDNLGKSTTTVAHNSSNFSILSWTTFSPIGGGSGNNNIVQFEPGTEHVDDTEGKTICENFNYTPLHKENVGFGNIMPSESFPTDSALQGVDKSKAKSNQKQQQSFDDNTKTKNIQPMANQEKPSRNHNSNINEEFKYNTSDNKNKSKYLMDSSYTQTEFAALEQQRHQHISKSHQIVTSKSEKTNYSESGYDSQVSFDITDTVTQSKCSDIYSGTNYKYSSDKEQHSQIKYQSILQTQAPVLHHDNSFNTTKQQQQQQQSNLNKKPAIQQQQQQTIRPPVNWMMTPEIKHNTNISDLILPPIGKELEFCQNNIFSQASSYNQTTSNQFYNNYEASVAGTSFPNVSTLQSDSRRITDGFYSEDQPFSWSPSKNPQSSEHSQVMKSIEQQVVPSTLPTLVGDLALGTNIPEKQSFLYGQMPPRPSNDLSKTSVKEKEPATSRDFHVMLNTQNVQHAAQGTSFLSVSQLVEHEKAEKSHQQANHHGHHHHHHTHHQQASQPQPRKHQRKSNTSPRSTGKRQMEMRKPTNDQQLQHADDQKVSSTHGYNEHSYQQPQQASKYHQNDVLWRNRNCKSNYTAEALIGVNNTSIHDGTNTDKQLHAPAIKFSTDYSQNKFPSGLSTEMVMPPINYLTNPEDGNGYGQVMNQNFNHSSYTYSPNANIYPSTNFMTGISNTPSSYMMPLHDNPTDYLEPNSFLLSNVSNVTVTSKSTANMPASVSSSSTTTRTTSSTVSGATNVKNHHQYGGNKHPNCDKRNSYSTISKKSKRKSDSTMHNLDFPIAGVASSMEDYHHSHSHHHHHHHHHPTHTSTFLPPPPPPPPHANPLYQNHPHPATVSLPPNSNRRGGSSSNPVVMTHHPSGTSLTNFNLSTIFPEINDKVTGYKPPNVIAPGLSQSSNHSSLSYPQRVNYSANNSLGHVPQVSEGGQFTSDLPAPPSVLHYKAT